VKELTVIVAAPGPAIVAVDGSVIANVYPGAPETVKFAAVTVPDVAGSVTPPPAVLLVPTGARITEPPELTDTAALPKFMFTFLAIVIGAMTVAAADAVAVACAIKSSVHTNKTRNAAIVFMILFLFISA
jgi:hypothetical protein